MKIDRFEDIEAWQLARELTRKIYSLTTKGNFAHDFGLKGQIQDAAGSYHALYGGKIRFGVQTLSLFVSFGMQNGLAPKSKVSFMSLWINNT